MLVHSLPIFIRHIANKGKNLPKHFGNLKCKAESINIFFISLLFSLSPFVSFVSFHFLLLKLGRCHSISFKVQSFISPAGALSPCQIVELGNEQQDISFFVYQQVPSLCSELSKIPNGVSRTNPNLPSDNLSGELCLGVL